MSQKGKSLVIAAFAVFVLSLTGMSALQVNADTELIASELTAPVSGFGNFCNNQFIACGGILVCPSHCYCSPLGSGSGICLQ
ncbi:MAG: hypothetical protein AAF560_09715 [Acidobacteriota bacterium]